MKPRPSSGSSLRLGIVVNTYENPKALERIFDALHRGSQQPDEVLIADDGSGAATANLVRAWCGYAYWPLVHCWQEKAGYRRSRILNSAIAAASADYLVFMDGDCIPHPRFVEDHRTLAEAGTFIQGRRAFVDESCVADFLAGRASLGQLACRGKVSGLFKALRLPWPVIRRDQNLHGILGCNLGIWRADLAAVNGYDEGYEGWGLEDSDLAARLYHLGRTRKLVHNHAVLFHLNHPKLPRTQYQDNKVRLDRTLETKATRCDAGLNRHLPQKV